MDGYEPYLTTVDNPYSPRDEFREWYAFDCAHEYYTAEILARRTFDSEDMSPADIKDSRLLAMEEIVDANIGGLHVIKWLPSG